MKDFKNDSDTTLSRFGRDKRERISSAERIERRPRLQRDAADSEHSSDNRPRASYNPNFTSDNLPAREERFGRDDNQRRPSGRSDYRGSNDRGERSFGSDDRRRDDTGNREFKPRFGDNKEGYKPRRYDDRKPGGYERSDKPYGERRFDDRKPGGFKKFDKPFGERRSDDRKSEGFDRSDKPYGERRFDDRKPGGFKKYDKPFGERRYNDRNEGGDRSDKPFGDRKPGGYDRSDKPFGERRFDDRKPGGFKKFDKPYGERRYDDRKPGGFRGGDRSFGRGEDKPKSYPKYNPNNQTGEMRLNRFVAQSGVCSRREADDFILAGLVTVNGEVVTTLGTKVMPTDEVKFNDSRVEGEKKVYLVLNKPKGYVTSLEDPHADKTVMELVKDACTERIYPVGRLDKNSVGLLLFTNDGDLTRQLTHPSFQKKKIYQVSLDKPLTKADMEQIAQGITLEDGEIYADEIAYVKEDKSEIGIEIHSGRNRIVRRIFEHLGYVVKKLDRVYYAGLSKKNLKRGQWRFLTREEVQRLKSGQYE